MNTPRTDAAFGLILSALSLESQGKIYRSDVAVELHRARNSCRELETELEALKAERDQARAINAELLAALKRIRDNIVPGETFDSFETDQIHEWASNSIAKAEGLTAS